MLTNEFGSSGVRFFQNQNFTHPRWVVGWIDSHVFDWQRKRCTSGIKDTLMGVTKGQEQITTLRSRCGQIFGRQVGCDSSEAASFLFLRAPAVSKKSGDENQKKKRKTPATKTWRSNRRLSWGSEKQVRSSNLMGQVSCNTDLLVIVDNTCPLTIRENLRFDLLNRREQINKLLLSDSLPKPPKKSLNWDAKTLIWRPTT
jgi:hypothetical protein